MSIKFALIGAAGYIAPRHLQAIKDVDGELIAALDPHDSVGILDKYFPHTKFFTEEHRFRRFLDKNLVDYISICSPNYLHYGHIILANDAGAHAICEKPLVINPDNLEELKFRRHISNRIYPIMQLRYHPLLQKMKTYCSIHPSEYIKYSVKAFYNTYRGPWYDYSWKNDKTKSGGLAVNLGVHLFDMLIQVFGHQKGYNIVEKNHIKVAGNIQFEKANVYFSLTTRANSVERIVTINNAEFDWGKQGIFENLHTRCYQEILAGRGLSIEDVGPSLRLATNIEKLGDIG